jgi:PAS domain S-box-containing protein
MPMTLLAPLSSARLSAPTDVGVRPMETASGPSVGPGLDRDRRADAGVIEANLRYQAIFDDAPDALLVADSSARYVEANGLAVELTGYSHEELLCLHVRDLIAGEAPWADALNATAQIADRWRGELEVRRKNGSLVPVEAGLRTIEVQGQTFDVSVLRDMSQRRLRERGQADATAIVQHELRNPIAAIKGYVQLLKRRARYDERAIAVVLRQVDLLDRLASDLNDFVGGQEQRLGLRCERLNPFDEVTAAIELVGMRQSGHVPNIEAPDRSVEVWADRARVGQVFANLLGNAVKYSPSGGEVHVRIVRDRDWVAVSVSDTGVGIPPSALTPVFDRYYRVPQTLDQADGEGLGLYITRAIVEAHGGAISVQSVRGRGSTFTFTLPRA